MNRSTSKGKSKEISRSRRNSKSHYAGTAGSRSWSISYVGVGVEGLGVGGGQVEI